MAISSRIRSHRTRSPRWSPSPPRAPGFALSPVYRPRRPAEPPLYPVVQHHLETFLAEAEQPDGRGVQPWVEHDFRRYLTCGILAHGFARLRCDACAQERLLAFSCKGRGVCPSCTTRRMAEVAAHLTDHVIPHVPARQWVLSLPKRLRPYLARDPVLVGRILAVLLRIIRRALREAAPDAPPDATLGAVSFLHRFGSSLNPHLHLHLVVLDGLFARKTQGSLAFHRARGLDADAARALTPLVQDRVLRLFVRRRLLDPHEAADMRTWRGTGGFSLDGSVRIEAHDRASLERLIRYCARPPFALNRLHAPAGQPSLRSPDARLIYRLTRPLADGRTALRVTPLELLERLARLIPPPRAHRHRYHGVLAPNARLRPDVVRYGRPDHELRRLDDLQGAARASSGNGLDDTIRTPSPARIRWAQLLARVYELDPLRCPGCDGTLRIVAFLTEPDVVKGILRHLRLPHRPPPLAPARAPPQAEIDFDQTPRWERESEGPAPPRSDLDPFDQSLPGDDGTWSA